MKLYLCKCSASDKRYCLVTRHGSPFSYPLAHGVEVASRMEDKGVEAVTFDLDEARGALELPDLVGTNLNFLILRKLCADAILGQHDVGEHEVVSAVLVNSKERVHASDYVVLNPHGKVECLDTVRSEMDDDDDDPAVALFGKFWLKAALVPPGRDIFRVKGLTVGYVFSERLVEFIRAQGFSNFVFEDVQLS
ncbi:hypothetical protein [Paraliomyxa miuraensis]|uniref:hypothetical protein n=1 Tax=Paraliomyxa miuraensis TaxID=376150 RepID=UPI0022502DC4|nr:hypothetical protein [Paraliomyxa miuraensis]MCX4242252.1 double-CXXCG motif protein [Paraliomyxa miuraensis]